MKHRNYIEKRKEKGKNDESDRNEKSELKDEIYIFSNHIIRIMYNDKH